MTKTETSSPVEDLTVTKGEQENPDGSSETEQTDDLPEGSKNWQHALQIAREREKKLQEEAEAVRKQLKAFQDAKKEQEMADMSETEKLKTIADEEIAKRGKLELKLVIREIIGNKTIPTPIRDLLERTPWAIPAVQDELGDTFSWDEAIDAVKRHLPAYVESVVVRSETEPTLEPEPSPRKIDSERSFDASVTRNHVYTRDEIAEIAKDPQTWEKHRDRILKQLAQNKGQVL